MLTFSGPVGLARSVGLVGLGGPVRFLLVGLGGPVRLLLSGLDVLVRLVGLLGGLLLLA